MEFMLVGFVLSVLSAVAYRMRGSNENDIPSIFKSRSVRRLLCLVVLAVSAIFVGAYIPFLDIVVYNQMLTGLIVVVLAAAGLVMGHGSYFPNNVGGTDNEKTAFITNLIADPLNNTAIFVGMALTGLLITVPVALIPCVSIWYVGIGILKPVGYYVSYWIRDKYPEWTANAELFWGFAMVAGMILTSLI